MWLLENCKCKITYVAMSHFFWTVLFREVGAHPILIVFHNFERFIFSAVAFRHAIDATDACWYNF